MLGHQGRGDGRCWPQAQRGRFAGSLEGSINVFENGVHVVLMGDGEDPESHLVAQDMGARADAQIYVGAE